MRISDWSSDVCSSDLPPVTGETPDYGAPAPDTSLDSDLATGDEQATGVPEDSTASTGIADPQAVATSVEPGTTYEEDDMIGAAEGVFGKGARGLASLMEDIVKEQGEANAYIRGSDE